MLTARQSEFRRSNMILRNWAERSLDPPVSLDVLCLIGRERVFRSLKLNYSRVEFNKFNPRYKDVSRSLKNDTYCHEPRNGLLNSPRIARRILWSLPRVGSQKITIFGQVQFASQYIATLKCISNFITTKNLSPELLLPKDFFLYQLDGTSHMSHCYTSDWWILSNTFLFTLYGA